MASQQVTKMAFRVVFRMAIIQMVLLLPQKMDLKALCENVLLWWAWVWSRWPFCKWQGHAKTHHPAILRLTWARLRREKLTKMDAKKREYDITVIGEESHLAYNRVGLSTFFEHRLIENLYLNPQEWVSVAFSRAIPNCIACISLMEDFLPTFF